MVILAPIPVDACTTMFVQNLKSIVESFTGPFRKELEGNPNRRVLHEGYLTKIRVDSRTKHKRYMVCWLGDMVTDGLI